MYLPAPKPTQDGGEQTLGFVKVGGAIAPKGGTWVALEVWTDTGERNYVSGTISVIEGDTPLSGANKFHWTVYWFRIK